jgi:hypothetical protein
MNHCDCCGILFTQEELDRVHENFGPTYFLCFICAKYYWEKNERLEQEMSEYWKSYHDEGGES